MDDNNSERTQITLIEALACMSIICVSLSLLRFIALAENWLPPEFAMLLALVAIIGLCGAIGAPIGRCMGSVKFGVILAVFLFGLALTILRYSVTFP
jgi:hypothetical protein